PPTDHQRRHAVRFPDPSTLRQQRVRKINISLSLIKKSPDNRIYHNNRDATPTQIHPPKVTDYAPILRPRHWVRPADGRNRQYLLRTPFREYRRTLIDNRDRPRQWLPTPPGSWHR